MEKYITFSVRIIKKCDDGKTITHKLRFIDNFRSMPASLSDLFNNFSEINKEECKACMNGENIKSECEFIGPKNNYSYLKCKKGEKILLKPSLLGIANSISEINKKECKTCMERKNILSEFNFIGIQDNKLSYKCKKCNKNWLKPVDELIKKFSSIYQFWTGDLSKFVLLLRRVVLPYEDMDRWNFCSNLNLENITDKDYAHVQKVWDAFEIKDRGEYHDLYVLYDTLLLADVFV